MSILQKIGFALIGQSALAEIKKEVVTLTTATVQAEEALKRAHAIREVESNARVGIASAEQTIKEQAQHYALSQLVGAAGGLDLIAEARAAELSGEGFMKKKARVHKLAKTFELSKSRTNLAVELAVQLSK